GGRQGIGGSWRHGGRGILAADDRPERYERETEDGETRLHERLLVSMSAGKRGVRASRARPGELSYDCRANASRARIVTPVRPAGVPGRRIPLEKIRPGAEILCNGRHGRRSSVRHTNPAHTRREAIRVMGAAGVACSVGALLGEPLGLAQGAGWLTAKPRTKVVFPRGAMVRTVLKDVDPDALASGATAFHEHVAFSYSSPPVPRTPGKPGAPLAESIELIAEELRQAAFDGLGAIVDANASGRSGRTDEQLEFLKQVATRVPKVHVLVAGGPFQSPYTPQALTPPAHQLTPH